MKDVFTLYKPIIHSIIAFLFQIRVGDKYQPEQCYSLTKVYLDRLQQELPKDNA